MMLVVFHDRPGGKCDRRKLSLDNSIPVIFISGQVFLNQAIQKQKKANSVRN